jgi:HK97 family phage portal protein
MRWPWSRRPENATYSISDPRLAALFGAGPSDAGVEVSEHSAIGVSSVWRAVNLIAGSIAGLPLQTMRTIDAERTTQVTSFLDERPAGPVSDLTPFEWTETLLWHGLLHGNAYLAKVFNGAGAIIGLVPFHPMAVTPEWELTEGNRITGRKLFRVTTDDGRLTTFDESTMVHIPGPSSDGLRGYSALWVARNSFGKSIAADRAAARMFSNGAMISGMVTPDEDFDEDEAKEIKAQVDRKVSGWENAGQIAVINRKLKFTPWTMTSADAQFLESRVFEVEEVARWFGLLPIHLSQTEKQTSWGTGVAEQNRGLARFTFQPHTKRIEQRISRVLAQPRFVRYDYGEILQPAHEQLIPLVISQVKAGLITPNEGRKKLGLDTIEGGDQLRTDTAPAVEPTAPAEPEPEGAPA